MWNGENQTSPGLLLEWQKCRYHCYHRTGEREKLADAAANRSEYAAVCRKLKKFSENSPIAARALARELQEAFPRKRAFLEELKKAGF